ncbi:M56 family metallopeptidase [Flagellimonas halotolerans]|uniref:M56 family metallopeptidase n=1 Tax=Flagellimonas halotolerans TaxID=3112164 RepID=A0ABU6IPR4_9FLAO|nr:MULTISPECIES: M56 family metallopeptidase [unclassified Allomuricauda]MEC3965131.1 M56 family metallopeptidase [Muricauda sp. SYSU M86414]MEC4265024.1 M56 family metallopeptidase [Muricauda sp. SYSU M84420]
MEPIFMYFLQSALISGGFLAVYHIFLKRDTLFTENRMFLLSGLILAFVLPFIKIKKTVVVSKPILIQADELGAQATSSLAESSLFTAENILLILYSAVSAILLVKFMIRLISLKKLAENAHKRKESPFLHLETEKRISPFSFFNYIFYNPTLFEPNELHSVLEHEKVHARQYHTLDILFLEVLKIVFWFNPVLWLYKSAVRQNLEYLADHFAIAHAKDKNSYQYLMLKQAVDTQEYVLANSFYNSLIKKRIVMLNQNQSKKINVLKTLLVAPLLGLLLVSFSIEETYLYKDSDNTGSSMTEKKSKDNKKIEFTVDKNTSDAKLDNIKKDLAKDDIDFSYTAVRNNAKEIIGISLQLSGKNDEGKKVNGNYSTNSDGAIGPITVIYDDENNVVSFWNSGKKKNISIHKIKGTSSWTTNDETEVTIKQVDNEKVVIVDGKRLSDKEAEKLHIEDDQDIKHISIKKIEKKGEENNVMVFSTDKDNDIEVKRNSNVTIIKDSDNDGDIEVISNHDNASFFFIDNDGKGEPLYYIDGKKAKAKDIKKILPSDIKSMTVLKGDKAIDKYGKKAKNGVVEITTKKGK